MYMKRLNVQLHYDVDIGQYRKAPCIVVSNQPCALGGGNDGQVAPGHRGDAQGERRRIGRPFLVFRNTLRQPLC